MKTGYRIAHGLLYTIWKGAIVLWPPHWLPKPGERYCVLLGEHLPIYCENKPECLLGYKEY